AGEIQIRLRAMKRRRADPRHLGCEALELLEVAPGAEHEHAAVPVVVARLQELLGTLPVGFLHEARNAKPLPARSPALDVAVGGLGAARDHAEGDELPGLRRAERRRPRL